MTRVLFFAQLAETANVREVDVTHPNELNVRELAELAVVDLPDKLREELFDGTVMVAVNKKRADWETRVAVGDEVAFLPPFSGG